MSDYAKVVLIVEGPTEQRFVKAVLGPSMWNQNILLTPIILDNSMDVSCLSACGGVNALWDGIWISGGGSEVTPGIPGGPCLISNAQR